MKGILCGSLLILLVTTVCAASSPGDSANGKRLYDANCVGCHDASVFTRKDRVVQSLDDLKKQLASCALGTCYCLIFCVKNFRIQCTYIVIASIDNPLPRLNRHLPELCIKIETELTTNYNVSF